MTRIVLPWPPSVHGVFRRHNGAHMSAKYRAWRDEAGWELKRQKPGKHAGRVAVSITFCPPDRRRHDIDNCLKGVLDLLVAHEVIEADDMGCLRSVTGSVVDRGEPCVVVVTPAREAQEEAFQRGIEAGMFAGMSG